MKYIQAEVQEFEDEKTQVDFRFDKFFFKYYFLLVFTLISINRKRKQLEILLRNSISKKFCQIESQLGFFHPWIPAPLATTFWLFSHPKVPDLMLQKALHLGDTSQVLLASIEADKKSRAKETLTWSFAENGHNVHNLIRFIIWKG